MMVRTAASTSARLGFCTSECGVLARSNECTFGLTVSSSVADVESDGRCMMLELVGWSTSRKVPRFNRIVPAFSRAAGSIFPGFDKFSRRALASPGDRAEGKQHPQVPKFQIASGFRMALLAARRYPAVSRKDVC